MSYYRSWIGGEPPVRYISSVRDDVEIVEEVVKVAKAHVQHLAEVGAAPREAAEAILDALSQLDYRQVLAEGFEDVHEALEKWLVDRLGEEVGGWLGLGRSRNDHVAAAIRLAALRKAGELRRGVERLRCVLARRALEYSQCAMPSFTHFQPAQVITFGHYLMAVDGLAGEFLQVLASAEGLLRKSPLGAGPAGGVRPPVDRRRLAELAGFSDVVENSLYASGGRFFMANLAAAVASFLVELSRAVDDFIRWNSPVVGYIKAPPGHLSTSSIMPHKRNLVTLEVFRGRAMEAVGHLTALLSVISKVGVGYSLDLQEATRHLWSILDIAIGGVEVFRDFVEKMEFDCQKARQDAERYYSTSSDTVEAMALGGTSFRRAYFQLAREIGEGQAHLLSVEEALRRPAAGSANPEEVKKAASRVAAAFCGSGL
ncbi:MAG: lyase family protein [Pyrobaculum sp.]